MTKFIEYGSYLSVEPKSALTSTTTDASSILPYSTTSYLERYGDSPRVPFSYAPRIDGSMQITNGRGDVLNDFLPPTISFIDKPDSGAFFMARGQNVIVNMEHAQRLGAVGSANLAHEVGHALNPLASENTKHFRLDMAYIDNLSSFSPSTQLEAATRALNNRMIDEVDAWNYGKETAIFLGIDEAEFEDIMRYGLASYYLSDLGLLKQILARYNVDLKQPLSLYDISLQETVPLTAGDIALILEQEQQKGRSILEKIKQNTTELNTLLQDDSPF
jgi:hypothetical protein